MLTEYDYLATTAIVTREKNEMTNAIQRPIFIIGSGRSGTTVFYRLLAGHGSLGWLSSYVNRFPGSPWLARLNVLYQAPALVKRYQDERWFPKPVEAFPIWDRFHPLENSLGSPPLTEEDVSEADVEGMLHYVSKILRFSRRARFMNKNTRNTRRIRYLHAIFPDALFIHVIRDGRAVTNSFLNVDWWPMLSLWWAEGKTPVELQREGVDPVLIAARLWRLNTERVLQDKQYIPLDQYAEVHYEKLMQDPVVEMRRILDFCGLPWTPRFRAHIEAFDVRSRNFKWADRFTVQQIVSIEEEIGPLLEQFGYL